MFAQLPGLNDKCVVRVQDFIMGKKLMIAYWWEECSIYCVVQFTSVLYAVPCIGRQFYAGQCSAVQYSAVHFQCSAVHKSAVQCSAVQCSTSKFSGVLCSKVGEEQRQLQHQSSPLVDVQERSFQQQWNEEQKFDQVRGHIGQSCRIRNVGSSKNYNLFSKG